MANQPTRATRNMNANEGRIIRVERLFGRLEKRIERLEMQNATLKAEVAKGGPKIGPQKIAQLVKQNANLKAEISKLRARVDQNAKDNKQNASTITRLDGLTEPVKALVRSFKQTPGAPFAVWTMWMVSTFRKQGVYRKQIFR